MLVSPGRGAILMSDTKSFFDAIRSGDLGQAPRLLDSEHSLLWAVTAGHTEILKSLVKRGLDPNYRYGPGYTPLLASAANGHLEIVKLLLANGATPAATADDGKSALVIATERNHAEVAEFLR